MIDNIRRWKPRTGVVVIRNNDGSVARVQRAVLTDNLAVTRCKGPWPWGIYSRKKGCLLTSSLMCSTLKQALGVAALMPSYVAEKFMCGEVEPHTLDVARAQFRSVALRAAEFGFLDIPAGKTSNRR